MSHLFCNKTVHPSRREAKRHLDRAKSLDRRSGIQDRLSIYWCEKCDGFHIGHKRPKGIANQTRLASDGPRS